MAKKKRQATRLACTECGETYGRLSLHSCRICKREFCSTCSDRSFSAGACSECVMSLVADAARATVTEKDLGDARTKIAQARKITQEIADKRDELRELYGSVYDDLREIAESVGDGTGAIMRALNEMEDGIDRCSERL